MTLRSTVAPFFNRHPKLKRAVLSAMAHASFARHRGDPGAKPTSEAVDQNALNQTILNQNILSSTRHFTESAAGELRALRLLMAADFVERLRQTDRYRDPLRIAPPWTLASFSGSTEDACIAEIFSRIGTTNRFFVEFGAFGPNNNTTEALVDGWRGIWIEKSDRIAAALEGPLRPYIDAERLRVIKALVTVENINDLFRQSGVPAEFDLLSIDVDGVDYWLWRALEGYRPRVVVIEYNAAYGPRLSFTVPYSPDFAWDETSYFGASLKALEKLGGEKGYSLVACDYIGTNGYFVRDDLVANKFRAPFTSENHYEPPRYFLGGHGGHPSAFGQFTAI